MCFGKQGVGFGLPPAAPPVVLYVAPPSLPQYSRVQVETLLSLKPVTCVWNAHDVPLTTPLFDIEVDVEGTPEEFKDANHNYFANGVLVSNSHITLAEPMPNPLFERAVKALTGLDTAKLDGLMSGRLAYDAKTKQVVTDEGQDGVLRAGYAIESMLKGIDRDRELDDLTDSVPTARGTELDRVVKKLKILRALKAANLQPTVYVQKLLPILPPQFRPISVTGGGDIAYADLNAIYKAVALDNQQLQEFPKGLPDSEKAALRAETYDGLKSLIGLGGTLNREQELSGVMDVIHGSELKHGFFQKMLLKRRQDMTARGVIVPDLDIGLDDVGIPKSVAKTLYEHFVVRALGQPPYSMSVINAKAALGRGDDAAMRVLENELASRPLAMKRDPALHKHNIQGFYPKIVAGHSIHISPLVVVGYNADFDGNCIVGSSKVLLKFSMPSGTLPSLDFLSEVYGMRLTGESEIVLLTDSSAVVEVKIEDFPCIEGSGRLCKDGSTQFDVPAGVQAWSYDHTAGAACWESITAFTVEDARRCCKVVTRSGLDVTVSDNESLCVYDHNAGALKKVKPEGSEGMLVPVLRDMRVQEGGLSAGPAGKDVLFGWMIGAFASDGFTMGDRGAFGYTKVSDVHRARFAAAVSEFEGRSVKYNTYREPKSDQKFGFSVKDHYSKADRALGFFRGFYAEKGEGRAALYKRLPDLSMYSTDVLYGVLSGLIDGDGSISVSNAKNKPQLLANFGTSSACLKDGVVSLLRRLGIRSSVTSYQPKGEGRHPAFLVNLSTPDLLRELPRLDLVTPEYRETLSRFSAEGMRDDRDIVPVPAKLMTDCASRSGPCATSHSLQRVLATLKSVRKPCHYVTRAVAREMLTHLGGSAGEWRTLVEAERVHWDLIESVTDAGSHRVYDFMIPTTKVFALSSGLVVYDTVSLYVPVTNEAVEDVKRMVPTNILRSPAGHELMYAPRLESLLGLFIMTKHGDKSTARFKDTTELLNAYEAGKIGQTDVAKVGGKETTAGRALVAAVVDDGKTEGREAWRDKILYDATYAMDKKSSGKMLTEFSSNPVLFKTMVEKLTKIGFINATARGFSFNLGDFKTLHAMRDKHLAIADAIVAKIPKGAKDRDAQLVKAYEDAGERIRVEAESHYGKEYNAMFTAYKAGTKGSWTQLRQILTTPMLVASANGTIPIPIRHSYSEGLDTAEYWVASHGARKSMYDRVMEASLPGAINKQLTAVAMDMVIGEKDCGATAGVHRPVDSMDVLDRFTSEAIKLPDKIIPRGTLVTSQLIGELKRAKKASIMVRSPLKHIGKGVCAACYGLDASGKVPPVGANIGVVAAQSLGERGTQLALRSFHNAGATGAKSVINSIARVRQLVAMPEILPNQATLAQESGHVTKVEADPVGGFRVFIGSQDHYVPHGQEVVVQKGQKVKRGDALTLGPVNPHELLRLAGVGAVQNYLTDELDALYAKEGVRRVHAEVLVRKMTDLGKVVDSGDHEDLLPSDMTNIQAIDAWNSANRDKKPVQYETVLKGVEMLPLEQTTDWLARLAYRRPTEAISRGTTEGWHSDIHGTHPIAGIVTGSEFGLPKDKTKGPY